MRWIVVLLACISLAPACDSGDSSGPRSGANGSAESWIPPAAYTYEVDSSCGERSFIGRFRIHVRQGTVESVTALDASARAAIDTGFDQEVPTLEALLEDAIEAERSGADQVDVRHDDEGRPTLIDIDYETNAIDDEACYAIRRFQRVSASSSRIVRDGRIYASVIRQLVLKDLTFGRGRSPFRVVYVIDGSLPAAGRPRGDLFARPLEPFNGSLTNEIRESLEGDLPPVRFIGRAHVALQENANMGVTKEGVIIALGPIKHRSERVQVANTLWCGGKCSQWLTYVLREKNGRWVIRGTTGPVAIS